MSTVRADNYGNRLGTKSVPAGYVVDGTAKAWVSISGKGTPSVRASLNISSIVHNATGDYTNNYASAFANADYNAAFMNDNDGGSTTAVTLGFIATGPTASSGRIQVSASGLGRINLNWVGLNVFGALA
jgi:hypothetical protein